MRGTDGPPPVPHSCVRGTEENETFIGVPTQKQQSWIKVLPVKSLRVLHLNMLLLRAQKVE